MHKRTASLIGIAAVLLLFAGVFCGAAAAAGDGSETSPYEISTAAELTSFLTNAEDWTGQYGKIITSIEVTGGQITVTGTASKNLDLNGKTIKAVSGTFTNGLLNWSSSGTLTITDSVGSTDLSKRGAISGNSKTRPLYLSGGTVMMNSGKLTGGNVVLGGGNVVLGGGGVYMNSGTFELSGNAGIEGNYAKVDGGGVYMNGGTFTMKENASIKGNSATYGGGGGVYMNSGTFTMSGDSRISNNHQYGNSENGGGVSVGRYGKFTMEGSSSISGNTAVEGGGADIRGTFTMKENASIKGNSATYGGGGVYVGDGSFTMTDNSTVGGTGAGDGNSAAEGGGLYLIGGWVSINSDGAKIIGNTATRNGGGVYNNADYASGGFTLSCGSITKNTANNGGGVYSTRPVIITGCSISENTAKSSGGGVYSTSRVTIAGSASITKNTANVNGGGVFMNGGTFEMSENSRIFGNSATNGDGGGVYIWSAAYTMTGGEIIGNSAGGNGGGLYFAGTSYSMTGGSITQNSAAGDGGGVYYDGGGTYLKLTGGTPVIKDNTKSDGTTANNLLVTNPAHIRLDSPMGQGTDIRVTSPKPYPRGEFGDSNSHYFDDPNRGGAKFIKSDDGGLCGRINDVMNLVWDDTEEEVVVFGPALVSNALLTASSNETGDLTATLSPDKMVESVTLKGVDTSKVYKLNYKASSQLWESEIPKMTGSELLLKPFKLEITCDGEPYPDANLTIKFKVNPEKVKESGVKAVRLGHLKDISDKTSWEKLPVNNNGEEGGYYHLSVERIHEPTPFFVVAAVKSAPKKSSSSQGTSIWLTETPTLTPTATPTATPTPAPTQEVPAVKPVTTETPAAKSPAAVMGVLAGLGAAAVLALRRK